MALETALTRLDRYDLLVLDDLSYVRKDQAETSVLFELISKRYERRSLLITANQPFGEWNKVLPDPAMTIASIDRLVHHSTVIEMNVESYRQRAATRRKSGRTGKQRPTTRNERAENRLKEHATCQRQSGATIISPSATGSPSRLTLATHPDRRATASIARAGAAMLRAIDQRSRLLPRFEAATYN